MRTNLLRFAVIVLIGFFSLPTSSQEAITISTGDYPPFVSKDLKHNGYVSHVISEAFARKNVHVEFKYMPWKRAYEEAKQGDYDATSFWYDSEERRQHFYYSDPVNHEKTVFFYRKANPLKDWSSLSDLKNYKIGATNGYTYTEEFWAMAESKELMVYPKPHDLTNMKKLVGGRIDLFPAGIVLGSTLLYENFDPAIVHTVDYHSKPLTEATGYLLFPKASKNSERLLKLFNAGLKQLEESGRLEKMYDDLITGRYKNTPLSQR
ncbi:MAG: transporter substrate-binding domain-containing protein [Oleiphilaceae bacterium]|nr:transporter substrate-binding domain-containing protein [Oleiphilaceae bacterium]